jgi:hypothetical protein
MGNRGSKSGILFRKRIPVKEQRVDGSWCNLHKYLHLRCTLMGFERNYQVKYPSKQLSIKKFSTLTYPTYVNPWFWTGLIDAEGSFSVIIDKNQTRKLG